MAITYPPEMLPSPDEGDDVQIIVCANDGCPKDAEIARLRAGLEAALRAAKLALFVIRKQDVMPNSSWQAGFEKDMATATSALSGSE